VPCRKLHGVYVFDNTATLRGDLHGQRMIRAAMYEHLRGRGSETRATDRGKRLRACFVCEGFDVTVIAGIRGLRLRQAAQSLATKPGFVAEIWATRRAIALEKGQRFGTEFVEHPTRQSSYVKASGRTRRLVRRWGDGDRQHRCRLPVPASFYGSKRWMCKFVLN